MPYSNQLTEKPNTKCKGSEEYIILTYRKRLITVLQYWFFFSYAIIDLLAEHTANQLSTIWGPLQPPDHWRDDYVLPNWMWAGLKCIFQIISLKRGSAHSSSHSHCKLCDRSKELTEIANEDAGQAWGQGCPTSSIPHTPGCQVRHSHKPSPKHRHNGRKKESQHIVNMLL